MIVFCSNHTRQNTFSVLLNFWIVSLYSLVHVIGWQVLRTFFNKALKDKVSCAAIY